jgi:MYXO-CTERM domain-containing protein
VGTIDGSSPAFTNAQPLDIGRNPIIDNNGSWEYFTGGIDEVSIYNRLLQPADVAEHYLVATTPEPSSLVLALFGGGALALWRIERNNGRRQANRTLTASEATSQKLA